eukprot:gene27639-34111_t
MAAAIAEKETASCISEEDGAREAVCALLAEEEILARTEEITALATLDAGACLSSLLKDDESKAALTLDMEAGTETLGAADSTETDELAAFAASSGVELGETSLTTMGRRLGKSKIERRDVQVFEE